MLCGTGLRRTGLCRTDLRRTGLCFAGPPGAAPQAPLTGVSSLERLQS